MSAIFSVARRRTPALATLLAAALAFAGLTVSPAAQAAAPTGDNAATATVSPTTVQGGSTTEFTVRVEGGNLTTANTASRVEVTVPTGFNNVNVVAGSFTKTASLAWSQTISGSSPSTIVFVQSNSSQGLGSGDWLQVKVTATAIGKGSQSWTTKAFKGTDSASQALTVLSSPEVAISGGTQAITFGQLADRTWGDADFPVSASSTSSANPITFSAAGDCSVTGASVHLLGAGSCTVTAHQAAGNGYTAAADVPNTFGIAKAAQSITFAEIPEATYTDSDIALSATATSRLAVSYTTEGSCMISEAAVRLTGAGSCSVTASQSGNENFLAAPAVTRSFGIAKAGAQVSLSDLQYTYDGDPHAVTVTTDPAGLQVDVTYTKAGESVTSPADAGTYAVTATVKDSDYAGSATGRLSIARASVTGHFTADDKTYDGGTDATVLTRTLTGILKSDDVRLTGGTAAFATKDAHAGKTVTLTGAELSGAASSNYTLDAAPITTQAAITPLRITATLAATDKEYDGDTSTASSGVSASPVGVLSKDAVTVAIDSATFDGTDVGQHLVTAAVRLVGADADNYTLEATSISDPAGISPRLVAGSFTVSPKVYDGDTDAVVATSELDRPVAVDDVALIVSNVAFADKNVGTWSVNATFTLGGSRAPQYTLALGTGSTSGSITPKPVTGSFTPHDKVWDNTADLTVTDVKVIGKIDGDDVALQGAPTMFPSTAVGDYNFPVTGLTLSGSAKGNYTLIETEPTPVMHASITAKYRGTGFYKPVDMSGILNTVKGGQTVPLKFEIFDATTPSIEKSSLTVFGPTTEAQAKSFTTQVVDCATTEGVSDPVEVTTTGSTSLRYDATAGQFIQNWKTPTTIGPCYAVTVKTEDGTKVGPAYFKITK